MQRLVANIAVALLIVAAPASAAEDTLSYSGSSTIGVGIMQAGAVKAFEAKTGLKFNSVETIIDFMLSREGQQIVAHNFVPLKR
jgi:ABC-type thiamine transport system substrate-binding protein